MNAIHKHSSSVIWHSPRRVDFTLLHSRTSYFLSPDHSASSTLRPPPTTDLNLQLPRQSSIKLSLKLLLFWGKRINHLKMFRDISACNTYNYGDSLYWDARYIQEANCGSFDWYQRYSSLRPFVRKYIPTSSRVLMVGCGNALMSEDMVQDGYEEIVNIDISSVAIEMMRMKYEHVPQLKYMQMDVRDMSFFPDETFDSVIDKGTLDSLMCGNNAPISAAQMMGEVCRLLKPGGVYMLITYGDPTVRIPHLSRPVNNWKIELYIIPRPGFRRLGNSATSGDSFLEPVPITDKGQLPADYVLEDPDSHFIYICKKADEPTNFQHPDALNSK